MIAKNTIPSLSLLMAAGVAGVSCTGLLIPGFYSRESVHWQVQTYGQDLVDLCLVVPVLLISAVGLSRGRPAFAPVWAGTVLYLLYTFTIYCFDVHFNRLFLIYCLVLGLSFYGFLTYIIQFLPVSPSPPLHPDAVPRRAGYYLILVAGIFSLLWLKDILPATFDDAVPQSLADVGLPTNPVHVMDLAIFLPGMAITGVLLLRNHYLGWFMAPVILAFTVLMNLTIAILMILMSRHGFAINPAIVVSMGVLACVSMVLMKPFIRYHTRTYEDLPSR